ncbi:MAG: hypothetical protein V3W41_18660 [Planctomycetota bacterium]
MPTIAPARALKLLQGLKYDCSSKAAEQKLELLASLEHGRLSSSQAVYAFHELAGYMRAYPENAEILEVAERISRQFDARPDLERFRQKLIDTGIAGTAIQFRFYWLTAIFLVKRWPENLTIQWKDFEHRAKLSEWLHLLLPFSETAALDSFEFDPDEWIDLLKGPDETDAAFLIERFEAMPAFIQLREKIYEDLDIPMLLEPGIDTPARGRERWPDSPVVFRDAPPPGGRPNLKREIPKVAFEVDTLDPKTARKLIDLANTCMVPRHRDLLIFLYADPHDVRMIDLGDGLQLACMGAVPERRLMLESVYGFLTLMNGVPVGYVLCSAFYNSAEVAYNVFETYRGAAAADTYCRVLAVVAGLFGVDSFAIDPYQLGHNNAEGQNSGAWWFYQKLGFRPHNAKVRALEREELARMKKEPGYRSSPAKLNDMASEYMFLQLKGRRNDVLGKISLGNIGLKVSEYLAQRFGHDREGGLDTCEAETAKLLGLPSRSKLARGEHIAWRRWAPLVLAIPDVAKWTQPQRFALRDVIRAKGGPQEADFVRLLDRHAKLRTALLELSKD